MLNRTHLPYGMNGWQTAAREEIERAAQIEVSLGSKKGKWNDSTRKTKFRNLMEAPKRRDPDAMDVDLNMAKAQ